MDGWVAADVVDGPPEGFEVLVSYECWLLVDDDDDLEIRLAAQPGIDAVMREDREVFWVRSRLTLEQVRAAAIRALFEAQRAAASRIS